MSRKTVLPLHDKKQTGEAMYNICYQYKTDLQRIGLKNGNGTVSPLSELSLSDYYDFCRRIPYREDRRPVEVVGRPLELVKLPSMDCKKKAIMIGSYASYKKIPFRFIASSNRPSGVIHHVYPELLVNGKWTTYDATYRNYFIGMNKRTTAKEVL
jgi:hypothetical protein